MMTDKELEIKIDKAIKDELTSNDGYMPFFPDSEFAVSLRNRLVKLFSIPDVSGCFPDDKEIELHSNVHSDDSNFRPNTYSSYKEGMGV